MIFPVDPVVRAAMAEYGADGDAPMIGAGAFKRVFAAGNRAVLVSEHVEQFVRETKLLNALLDLGVPCLSYEDWRIVDGSWVVAVAPLCRRPNPEDYPVILDSLKRWAPAFHGADRIFYDLQVLMSGEGAPLVHDPAGWARGSTSLVSVKAVSPMGFFTVGVSLQREPDGAVKVVESTHPPIRRGYA